jgi:outer membrane lipoprotein-sorting protein
MRQITLTAVTVLCAATVFAADAPSEKGKSAEQWFQQMEAKLSKAKTVSLSFTSNAESEAEPFKGWKLKGTVAVMAGNKGRLEMNGGKPGGEPFKALSISSGTQTVQDRGKPQPAPKVYTSNLLTIVARSGFSLMTMPLPPEPFANPNFDLKEGFSASDFKLGKKEKIGERQTQRVDYVLSVKGNAGKLSASVWIDLKTGVPVKRRVGEEANKVWITETYEITLDGKVDTKKFELLR